MAVEYNIAKIVTDGLVLALDAGNTKSYGDPTITYVGGTSDSDNSSSFTLSGLQSGDLVLYFSAEDGAGVATPTGASWTAIPGLTTQPDNDYSPSSAAFYVFATGTSVTASGLNTGDHHVRVMIAFRGVNSTNPFDVNATEYTVGMSGLPNPPSITPVTDNSMIVAVGLLDDEDIANSISPPTGYTTALNMDSQGGADDAGFNGATIMTAYKLLATAAAEDPATFTSSNGSANDPNKGITIALRPGTSSTWTDLSGKGNNGTLTNGPTYSSNNGGYLDFDGSNDYVTLPELSIAGNEITFTVWNYGITAQQSSIIYLEDENDRRLLNIHLPWSDRNVYFDKGADANGFDRIQGNASNSQYQGWHHWAFTANASTGSMKVYLDGSLWLSGTGKTRAFNDATGTDRRIGRDVTGNNYHRGYIGNLMLYTRELSASEVLTNYNALKGRYA